MSNPKPLPILSLLLLTFWVAIPVEAQDVAGVLRGEIHWQGEVHLVETVTVDTHAQLRILPGTRVRPANAAARLIVLGELQILGEDGHPVLFDGPQGWQGIEISSSQGHSVIEQARFRRAENALTLIAAKAAVRHSHFEDCGLAIGLQRGAEVEIVENSFARNRIAVNSEMKSKAAIHANHFVAQEVAALQLSLNSSGRVEQNRFEKNRQGISIQQLYYDSIVDNRFEGNDVGIYCNQTQESPRIERNVFQHNRIGLTNYSWASPQVAANRFIDNEVALRNDQFSAPQISGNLFSGNATAIYNYRKSHPEVSGNALQNNQTAVFCDYSSYPRVHRNNFQGNDQSIRLGLNQSGDWERQFGATTRQQRDKNQAAAKRLQPIPQQPEVVSDMIDASNNWWGEETAEFERVGAQGNLETFFDRHDRPRVYYEGYAAEGYVFDLVKFAPWLEKPVEVAATLRPDP